MKAKISRATEPLADHPVGRTLSDTAREARRGWLAVAVLSVSLLVIGLDNTILNVALPTLQRELNTTAAELQWVVDAYLLLFAGLLLTAGSLGDRFGRRRALQVGLVVFATGSALAAYAPSPGALIAYRALMGVGGAFIMPSTLSIITNIFSGADRAKAIGIWTAVAGAGIALGPVTGGWLVEHYWWGSIFLVNIPIAAVTLVAGFFLVPESRDPAAGHPDPLGVVLSIGGLLSLVYGIIEAPTRGWTDSLVLAAFGSAVVLLGLFTAWELRAPNPMLQLRFFRNLRFSVASLTIALAFFALFGTLFFLTQYLQLVLGYSAFQAGARTLPVALGLMVGAPASARLAARFGTKLVVVAGMVVAAVGLGLLATATPTSGYWLVAAALLLGGLGIGIAMAPATDSVMGSLPLAKASIGSAMNDTARLVGGALGVAVLGTSITQGYHSHIAGTVANLPPQVAGPVRDSLGAALVVAARVGGPLGGHLIGAARQAFTDAMDLTLVIAAGVALLGAALALLLLPARPTPERASSPVDGDERAT